MRARLFACASVFVCLCLAGAAAERFPHKPFITELHNVTVRQGETAQFECRVISDLTPFISWFKPYEVNGSYTSATGDPYVEPIGVSSSRSGPNGQHQLHCRSRRPAQYLLTYLDDCFDDLTARRAAGPIGPMALCIFKTPVRDGFFFNASSMSRVANSVRPKPQHAIRAAENGPSRYSITPSLPPL